MAISFDKHRTNIINAWKDVVDEKTNTNWSLFGYEGQTYELKVVATGEGGLEELCDELNSGKIMYAFLRIEDPKTSLNKYLLINWQGEGAPVLRKGTCANHVHEVAKLLSGAHLTISARNEDDIDLERLLKKLSACSSAYSFKEPRAGTEGQKTPVGTNYSRVIPTKELNTSEMQNFWKKEEAEERQRVEAEKEAKRQEVLKIEQEQRNREEKEHQKREKEVANNAKLQSAHVPIKTSPQPLSPEKTIAGSTIGLTDAERMRQARNQEARELIGSRVGAAKAIFTKNTSESQLLTKLNTAPPAKPARNSIAQRINAFNQTQQKEDDETNVSRTAKIALPKAETPTVTVNETVEEKACVKQEPVVELEAPVTPEVTAIANNDDDLPAVEDFPLEPETDQFSTIKRSPHSKTSSLHSPDETSSSNTTDTAEEVRTKVSVTVQQPQSANNGVANTLDRGELPDLVNEDDFICQDSLGDLGLRARAIYDYQAADESEITFDPGDIITHIDQIDEGWWQGLSPDGTYGLFPANYVEIIN